MRYLQSPALTESTEFIFCLINEFKLIKECYFNSQVQLRPITVQHKAPTQEFTVEPVASKQSCQNTIIIVPDGIHASVGTESFYEHTAPVMGRPSTAPGMSGDNMESLCVSFETLDFMSDSEALLYSGVDFSETSEHLTFLFSPPPLPASHAMVFFSVCRQRDTSPAARARQTLCLDRLTVLRGLFLDLVQLAATVYVNG